MKFFIVLALVALASAKLNYNFNGQSLILNGQNAYGGLLSTGSYGLGSYGGYSSGLGLRTAGYGLAKTYAAAPAYATGLVLKAAPVARYGYANAGYSNGYSANYAQSAGPITAAIQSERSVQVVDVPSTGSYAAPQSVVIGPSVQPIDFEFQSQSSPISVRQTHIPGQPNAPQFSSHQEEPDLLKQEVVKPIVHEVTEAIQPYRKITQEVRPVQEQITQIVTRGQQQQQVAYAAPALQTVAVAQPALQTVAVAQPAYQTLALQAQPAYSTGYTTGYSSLNTLAAKPIALTGSTTFAKPLSYASSELSSADSY